MTKSVSLVSRIVRLAKMENPALIVNRDTHTKPGMALILVSKLVSAGKAMLYWPVGRKLDAFQAVLLVPKVIQFVSSAWMAIF